VLLPVLDDAKHYRVSPREVDKLIRAGAGWLAAHPARELITHRYLAHQRRLSAPAMQRLAAFVSPRPSTGGAPAALDRLGALGDRQRQPIRLLQSALTYRDSRLSGYDAAVADGGDRARRPGPLPALARLCSARPAQGR